MLGRIERQISISDYWLQGKIPENNSNIISNSSANPFELPMKVTGVVIESNDKSIAIIETAHTSYIVKVGDFISDSWQVRNIEENGVLLVNGQKEAHIPFDD
jgi:hypothetical protein